VSLHSIVCDMLKLKKKNQYVNTVKKKNPKQVLPSPDRFFLTCIRVPSSILDTCWCEKKIMTKALPQHMTLFYFINSVHVKQIPPTKGSQSKHHSLSPLHQCHSVFGHHVARSNDTPARHHHRSHLHITKHEVHRSCRKLTP